MRRFGIELTVWTGALALALAVSLSAAQERPAGAGARAPLAVFASWDGDPTTSVTIDWHLTPGHELNALEFRKRDAKEWKRIVADSVRFPFSERRVQRATLRGLTPGTEYELRLAGGEPYRYRTLPADLTRPIRFATGGDTRSSMETFGRMNAVVATFDPDFVLLGGDLSYSDGDPRKLRQEEAWFETLGQTLITKERRLIPVVSAIGNHEVFYTRAFDNDSAAAAFTARWGIKNAQATYFSALFPHAGQRSYGVIDIGDYLSIVLLDTDHVATVAGEQTEWLAQVLRDRRRRAHIFPIYHVPAYPSVRSFDQTTSRSVREHWVPLFEGHSAIRLVFENHDHAYKRTVSIRGGAAHPTGIVYVGDGAWGVAPREIGGMQNGETAWYIARAAAVNHAVIVTLSGFTPHVQVVDFEGRTVDQFSASSTRQTVAAKSAGRDARRNVPADYRTIGEAVAAALDGDTILVAPGLYREAVDLGSRNLTLASWFATTRDSSHIGGTVIDGGGADAVVRLSGTDVERNGVLGLTLMNGNDCVQIRGQAQVLDNRIQRCVDGVDFINGVTGGVVRGNVIAHNRDDGIDMDGSVSALVWQNSIHSNGDAGMEIRMQKHTGSTLWYLIRDNIIAGNGKDGIMLVQHVSDRTDRLFIIEGNVLRGNRMAGIGCVGNGSSAQTFAATPLPEPILIMNNLIADNRIDVSCSGQWKAFESGWPVPAR